MEGSDVDRRRDLRIKKLNESIGCVLNSDLVTSFYLEGSSGLILSEILLKTATAVVSARSFRGF